MKSLFLWISNFTSSWTATVEKAINKDKGSKFIEMKSQLRKKSKFKLCLDNLYDDAGSSFNLTLIRRLSPVIRGSLRFLFECWHTGGDRWSTWQFRKSKNVWQNSFISDWIPWFPDGIGDLRNVWIELVVAPEPRTWHLPERKTVMVNLP